MGHEHEHEHEEEEPLRFIASPLKHASHPAHSHNGSHDVEQGKREMYANAREAGSQDQELPWNRDGDLHQTPEFHRHEAAQSIELFYDLFFVANLTTFTGNHNINTNRTLASYVGFFCILWFTWYNATLYDVRFAVDSIVERIFKVMNFGVMMALALVGSSFDPEAQIMDTFEQLTLILMASRLILVAQYSISLFFTRKYKQMVLPMLMVIAMSFIAAMVYLGLYFKFHAVKVAAAAAGIEPQTNTYTVWYAVAVLETLLTTIVSCRWRIISFKGTHLQERLSLLTLIILGEGIILLCKSISYIVKGNWQFGAETIGAIICALLIIIFYYMIYFDRVVEHHFGTIRQQLWAFGHFPFHVATVLVLEGTRQFVVWRQALQMIDGVSAEVFYPPLWFASPIDQETLDSIIYNLTSYTEFTFKQLKDIDVTSSNATVWDALTSIYNSSMNGVLGCDADLDCTDDSINVINGLYNISLEVVNTEMTLLGIKIPKKLSKVKDITTEDKFAAYLDIFNFIYTYFFVAAGLTLVSVGILHWIATPPKKLGDWIRGGSNFVFGIGLAALAAMSTRRNVEDSSYSKFSVSPWILPTLTIVLFLNLVLNHARRPNVLKKIGLKRK